MPIVAGDSAGDGVRNRKLLKLRAVAQMRVYYKLTVAVTCQLAGYCFYEQLFCDAPPRRARFRAFIVPPICRYAFKIADDLSRKIEIFNRRTG